MEQQILLPHILKDEIKFNFYVVYVVICWNK